MPKRTWQPKKIKRARKHGYRSRSTSVAGRKLLKKRRLVGRHKLSV